MKLWRKQNAFTLIEVMVVVAVIGIIMAMGIPSIVKGMRKEGMRKASSDLVEACNAARAKAILSGTAAELVIRPFDGTVSAGEFSATLPNNVWIELLWINFANYLEADSATVRFYPNGTSDEFTILLQSDESKPQKISLEVVTGLAIVEAMP